MGLATPHANGMRGLTRTVSRLIKLGRLAHAVRLKPKRLLRGAARISDEILSERRVQRVHSLGAGLPVLDLLDLIPGFDETISTYSFLHGTSIVSDLALLGALARRTPDGRYLEIGTWRGESAAMVSPLVKEVVTVDLPRDQRIRLGYDRISPAYRGILGTCDTSRWTPRSATGQSLRQASTSYSSTAITPPGGSDPTRATSSVGCATSAPSSFGTTTAYTHRGRSTGRS